MDSLGSLVKQRVDRIIVQSEMLRAGFAALPYLVMKDKALTMGARMTYAFLLMYSWQEGSCFAGQQTLADEMGVSERQLQRYLYELRDTNYIKIERKDKRYNNTYIILDRKPSKLKAKKGQMLSLRRHPRRVRNDIIVRSGTTPVSGRIYQ